MPQLPALDIRERVNYSPHIVILGAGASRAATPNGDANGRTLPVMADLLDVVPLDRALRAALKKIPGDFEAVYSELHARDPNDPALEALDVAVRTYFTGLQLPEAPTAYDRLLLSLRGKDLIATFNWDPLLVQATIRNRHVASLPHVLFLHGNVAIGVCYPCRVKGLVGQPCKCGAPLEPTPLLYPVGEKNYEANQFISLEWEDLRKRLAYAYMLTVFGYGAPVSDIAAVALMRDAWHMNETRELAETDIIDIQERAILETRWEPFIVRQHYGISRTLEASYINIHPRRTCEALAFATLQNDPWANDRMPQFDSLAALHHWIEPLAAEEELASSGTPLSGEPHAAF